MWNEEIGLPHPQPLPCKQGRGESYHYNHGGMSEIRMWNEECGMWNEEIGTRNVRIRVVNEKSSNSSTCQLVNSSTPLLVYLSTHQLVN